VPMVIAGAVLMTMAYRASGIVEAKT